MKAYDGMIRKVGVTLGIAAIGALAGFQAPAMAASASLAAQNVTAISTRSVDQTHVFLSTDHLGTGQGCSYDDRAAIAGDDPGAKSMLATVMLAYALGKRVEVAVDGCVTFGSETFPKIFRVRVRD